MDMDRPRPHRSKFRALACSAVATHAVAPWWAQVGDGRVLTLENVMLVLYATSTPGHAGGTVSWIFAGT